ncbi:bifunctional methylenetetrahydrofolate dehydrogenase/methenyltetrahydrofolate cyclohydrolase [Candidatus Acetothermia bacterium]|nr:bifunctional methylenetetrahydrofolate dehydrogenase/methenyltetrahydrofolate cyclohydrolase [Candidatus Acetothermia bacterium]MBI3660915.1 bifunctional methylenetetrahydrofolate dehydrogenase/methenyltetrahydrofolate cyclohydrolase [Candidatus Acetothermia bacterium]
MLAVSPEKLIDGRKIASNYLEELKARLSELKARQIVPTLAVVFVGDNPASRTYFKVKEKLARELGINFVAERLAAEISEWALLEKIDHLNADPKIHGLFVEFPLPAHLRAERVRAAVVPEKDVDGITPENLGKLLIGQEGLFPSTPFGVIELLKKSGVTLRGKHAVVVGRSEVVGKPLALLLLKEDATVTICHSRTVDLAQHTRQADILCAAAGKPKMVSAEMVRLGAVVIDIGINATSEGIVGDVDFGPVSERASLITPVPGGVGPMTAMIVMRNTVQAAAQR